MAVTVDLSALARAAAGLRQTAAQARQTTQRVQGTLARRLPVEARRDMQREYALPARRLTEGLRTRREAEAVVLVGSKRGIGLIEFGGRWGGAKTPGASARVFASEAAHNYGGTFIARLRGGGRQIVSRAIVNGKRAGRLPIGTLYGPSVAQMLRKSGRAERLADFAQATLAAEIARLLRAA